MVSWRTSPLLSHLAERQLEPEWMDQPGLDPVLHHQSLCGLARLNAWSRSTAILWRPIQRLLRQSGMHALRILDLGSGAGDVTIGLWKRASRAGLRVQAVGYDISPVAVAHARRRARLARAEVTFHERDIFADSVPDTFDVVFCSLLLHHQGSTGAVELMRRMRCAARRLALMNDLERTISARFLVGVGSRLLSRSPIVKVDGQRSVKAAFTPSEALELATLAGWENAHLKRHWPCRFVLSTNTTTPSSRPMRRSICTG
jgi:SAM-dependent methyltransferase